MFANAFQNKTVWLSGATGFKGAWLAEWLLQLGARVHGFSLAPATKPALFEQLLLASRILHEFAVIRDSIFVRRSIFGVQPFCVFLLAAQSLVRPSYERPVETYEVNTLGTIHVLEALRELGKPCGAIFVTTDKCYENREQLHSYREDDPLGGHDPYSSSKAAAEIAIHSWRRSFFVGHPVRIASARAGNVIGGGDWAADRIVPDCVRALQQGQPILVRNKTAVRPWQHVLEPLSAYLWLAAKLSSTDAIVSGDSNSAAAFNFGPDDDANQTVEQLVEELLRHWPGQWEDRSDPNAAHEANLLQLATDKARSLLAWKPVWKFGDAVKQTAEWYQHAAANPDQTTIRNLTNSQINAYVARARELNAPWASS